MLRVRDKGELVVLVEEYISKTGIGATRFGWLATGDLSLVSKLRHKPNYDPSISTVTKVLDFLEQATVPEGGDDEVDFAEGL